MGEEIKIFCSYARKDEKLREELEKHLAPLRRQGLITVWHDREISAGMERAKETRAHLDAAQIILLLVSASFMDSDYCYSQEMTRALERHKDGKARVIPIILRPADWEYAPFGELSALPSGALAITKWSNKDEAFVDVARGIRKVVEELRSQNSGTYHVAERHIFTYTNSALSTYQKRNRDIALRTVRRIWIKEALEQSLGGRALVVLGVNRQYGLLDDPWRDVRQEPASPMQPYKPGTRITEIFDDAMGELLILGDAGSGKTTLLLELTNNLLDRARRNEEHPLPLVFHLSFWTARQPSLHRWMLSEMNKRYRIPRSLAEQWITSNQVLPLLDGFDNIASRHQEACVDAINTYLSEHEAVPLVVCSRTSYNTLSHHLRLNAAVMVQSLTSSQIDEYLASSEEERIMVNAALYEDPMLQELATNPLMLYIISTVYAKMPEQTEQAARDLLQGSSLLEKRRRFFAAYVKLMLDQKSSARYTYRQTLRQLEWLAWQMDQKGQPVFYIEDLQVDWLSNRWLRLVYHISLGLIFGLIVGLAGTAFFGALVRLIFGLSVDLRIELIIGMLVGLIVGLGGVGVGLRDGPDSRIEPVEDITWSYKIFSHGLRDGLRRGWVSGLVIGLACMLIIVIIVGVVFRQIVSISISISLGLSCGLLVGFFVTLIVGLREKPDPLIQSAPGIKGFFRSTGNRLLPGLGGGLIAGLRRGLLAGLASKELAPNQRSRPNQGIWRSARFALSIGPLFGLAFGLICALPVTLIAGPITGIPFGLVVASCAASVAGLIFGGEACIKHAILRLLLWSIGMVPWKYSRFLDYLAQKILLIKVGSGYKFKHELLGEYIAGLYKM